MSATIVLRPASECFLPNGCGLCGAQFPAPRVTVRPTGLRFVLQETYMPVCDECAIKHAPALHEAYREELESYRAYVETAEGGAGQ